MQEFIIAQERIVELQRNAEDTEERVKRLGEQARESEQTYQHRLKDVEAAHLKAVEVLREDLAAVDEHTTQLQLANATLQQFKEQAVSVQKESEGKRRELEIQLRENDEQRHQEVGIK